MQARNLGGALVGMVLAGAMILSVGVYGGWLDHLLFWFVLGLVLVGGFLLGERRR